MTGKTAEVIDRCVSAGHAALACYLPVGYPDLATSIEAVLAATRAGADVIELGIPYSDPVMDGPVIAAAADIALRGGVRVADSLAAAATITQAAPDVAVLLMTYWNPVSHLGVADFARRAAHAGVAGLITPDLPPDEAGEWIVASDAHGLERVFIVAPSSSDERLALASRESTGFVYAASTMGVTGTRTTVAPTARTLVADARAAGARRVGVGVGVSTPEQAREVADYADAVIVGSALVAALGRDGVAGVAALTEQLAEAVHGGSGHRPGPGGGQSRSAAAVS